MYRRLAIVLLITALAAAADKATLYLQDGSVMTVREYEVQGERVRYYSLERSQWEEIPASLVDLDKTRRTAESRQRRFETLRQASAAERAAERKARTELHNVPIEDGVYYFQDDQATPLEQREVLSDKSKKRGFLQILSPVPVFAGKNRLHVTGAHARVAVEESKPIFYLRVGALHQFGILRTQVEDKKDRRIVQTLQVVPQTKDVFEEQDEVQVFRQEVARNVYRVWPVDPLDPGEYAVYDFSPGEVNLRVWEFSMPAAGAASTDEPPSEE